MKEIFFFFLLILSMSSFMIASVNLVFEEFRKNIILGLIGLFFQGIIVLLFFFFPLWSLLTERGLHLGGGVLLFQIPHAIFAWCVFCEEIDTIKTGLVSILVSILSSILISAFYGQGIS